MAKWLDRRAAGRLLLGYGLAIGLFWLFARNAEWRELADALRSVGWPLVGLAIAVRLASLVAASVRWQLLLRPVRSVSLGSVTIVTMMGMAVSTLVSMQAAEAARPYLLSRRTGLDFGATAATAAVEWFLDALAVLVLFVAAQGLMAHEAPTNRLAVNIMVGAMVVASVACLAALRRLPRSICGVRAWIQRVRLIPSWLRPVLVAQCEQFAAGLRILDRPKGLAVVAGWSLLTSTLAAISAWLTLLAFGLPVTFLSGFLLLGLITIGGLVPTPGAVGGFHAICLFGLVAWLKLAPSRVVAPVVGLHAVMYVPAAAIGTLCLLATHTHGMARSIRMKGGLRGALIAFVILAGASNAWAQTEPGAAMAARGADIFARVAEANAQRDAQLQSYLSTRQYSVLEPGHEPDASLIVSMEFVAPSTKTFSTASAEGVGWIDRRVFRGLMNAEQQAAAGRDKADSAVTPANYSAQLVGDDRYEGRDCFVLALQPKKDNKYVFTGRAWIDKEDFAIARLEAEPVKSPSFWVQRAHLVREYQRVGGFWLPLTDETVCRIRFAGDYILRIRYFEYRVKRRGASAS